MILPIRTSVLPRRTPYLNYGIIAVNAAIFLLSSRMLRDPATGQLVMTLRPWAESFMLTPTRPFLWQFVTYAFLHGGFFHIIGNMYFLYIFGNNVNDKLGNVGYLGFYLAGAVFSGIGHTLLNNAPAVGASGAVAAVTGAYLVLFPKTLITIVYYFIFIGTMELPAIYLIGLKMILIDNVIVRTTTYVAYDAHLSGYAFGIAALLLLLATRLLTHDRIDLWFMLRQWNRRRVYRGSVSDGYDPFKGSPASRPVAVKNGKKPPADNELDEKTARLRSRVIGLISQKNLPAAAKVYLELREDGAEVILPQQQQLDLANQLMSMGKWEESASAYEKFLAHYKSYDYAEQLQLMLGILYSRYLDSPAKAVEYLKAAKDKLNDPGQLKMCDAELDKLQI